MTKPPHVHLAFAPDDPGLLQALTWFRHEDLLLGWFVAPSCGSPAGSYFVLPHDFAARDAPLLRSLRNDVEGEWIATRHGHAVRLAQTPVPHAMRRRLMRLQNTFTRHWLFFANDPDARLESEGLRAQGVPVGDVNLRAQRIGQLERVGPLWRHHSPAADPGVPAHLSRHGTPAWRGPRASAEPALLQPSSEPAPGWTGFLVPGRPST